MNGITNYFAREFKLSRIEKMKLDYSIEVLWNELSKLIILLILFSFIGRSKEFIFSFISLLSTRSFSGGVHFKSYKSCLLFSAIFFTTSIILITKINGFILISFLFVFSLVTMILIAPVISKNRPKYSDKKKLHFKHIAFYIILIHFIFYVVF